MDGRAETPILIQAVRAAASPLCLPRHNHDFRPIGRGWPPPRRSLPAPRPVPSPPPAPHRLRIALAPPAPPLAARPAALCALCSKHSRCRCSSLPRNVARPGPPRAKAWPTGVLASEALVKGASDRGKNPLLFLMSFTVSKTPTMMMIESIQ